MVEIKYTAVENILNKLYASKKMEEYEEFKTSLLNEKFVVQYRDIAWMRSHLVFKKEQGVIEMDEKGNPIRWRSHQYLTDEELVYLTDQLKIFY